MDLIGEPGERNGMEELQLRFDEEGLRGFFLLIISRFGRFAVRSDGVDRG
jgi:hypothetical protein